MDDLPTKTDLERFIALHESFGIKLEAEQPTEYCEYICVTIDGDELGRKYKDLADGTLGYCATYHFNTDGSFASLWTGVS